MYNQHAYKADVFTGLKIAKSVNFHIFGQVCRLGAHTLKIFSERRGTYPTRSHSMKLPEMAQNSPF